MDDVAIAIAVTSIVVTVLMSILWTVAANRIHDQCDKEVQAARDRCKEG